MADVTINGTSGDDSLRTSDTPDTYAVYGGDGNDALIDGSTFQTGDSYFGGGGDDLILAGIGNDTLDGGTGNDTLTGAGGDDVFLINDGFGTDSIDAGSFTETTGDVVDASGMTTDATLTFGVEITNGGGGPGGGGPGGGGPGDEGPGGEGGGGPGDEEPGGTSSTSGATLESGIDNLAEMLDVESYILGSGNDTVIDDGGDNTVDMGAGDDQFRITDDFGNDTVTGGEGGETVGDLLDGSATTAAAVVTFTDDGVGTYTDGANTVTFDELERIETGSANDTIFGGNGGESIDGNDGDDVFFFGDDAGDDFFRGGEAGETTGDILDGSALTDGVTITYTGDTATLSDGTNAAGFAEVEEVILGAGDDTVTGDTGNESIVTNGGNDTFAVNDNFGTDTVDLGTGTNSVDGSGLTTDATIAFSADGVGTLTSGANTVNFTGANRVESGAGDDSFTSTALNETIATHEGDDSVTLSAGFGNDSFDAGEGGETLGDSVDATGLTTNTTVTLNDDGSGTLTDGTSTLSLQDVERFDTGVGNDTITTSTLDETIASHAGDDTVILSDSFGNDSYDGGTGGETIGDRLDGSALTAGVTLTFTTPESGTIADGAATASFADFEEITLGSGDDTVVSSTGDDSITTGSGDDRFVVADGFGNDTFTAGAGDDMVDGAALTDNVTATFTGDDGTLTAGGATLTFTDVETLVSGSGDDTLVIDDGFGIAAFDAGDGSDEIDASAVDADMSVDLSGPGNGTLTAGSATLSFSDVETITTGRGDDIIAGGTGNDTVFAGRGNDSFGVADGFGDDTFVGGEIGDAAAGDNLDATALSSGATVTFTAEEAGTLSAGGNTVTFSEVEVVVTGDADDTIISQTGSGANAFFTNGGDDTLTLADGFGSNTFLAGETAETSGDSIDATALAGATTVDFSSPGAGSLISGSDAVQFFDVENIATGDNDDTFTGSSGDETLTANGGNDQLIIDDSFGNDSFAGGTGTDRIDASATSTDLLLNLSAAGAGTLTQGGNTLAFDSVEDIETGSGNDTIFGSVGDESLVTNAGADSFFVANDFGTDSISAGGGIDRLDAQAVTTDTTVTFTGTDSGTLVSGDDTVTFDGVEEIRTGASNDTFIGNADDQVIQSGNGDDRFIIDDGFGNDIFDAGPGSESAGDTLDASALSGDATITFTGSESGTLDAGTDRVSFTDVENIITGSGNDTFTGATGSETITANGGDDTLNLTNGFGNGSFDAGETGETTGDSINISTSAAVTVDFAGTLTSNGDTLDFSGVENVSTGTGNDSIVGSSANETINTNQGDDTFTIADNFGTDVFNAGEGGITSGDTLDASALTANATLDFSADEDGTLTVGANSVTFTNVEHVILGGGNDSVTGSAGAESLTTGDGNDRIEGNGGRDTIDAGAGNDRIVFAEGDSIDGGSGDDLFVVEDTGETSNQTITIDGGSEDTAAGDVLRLGALANLATLSTTDDGTGSLSGSVFLIDGTRLNFTDIETIQTVICFTPGTMIATPHGPRDIAQLRVGDMVRTRDSGPQPIRWIQRRTVPALGNFAPIRMRRGVVHGLTDDLLVSPQHRMLFDGYRAELLFGESEVLVSAKHLLDGKDVTKDIGGEVTYIHMMFDAHEIVYANGAASESFHPGTVGLTGVTDAAREELFHLFPELRSNPNGYGQTARRCLRKHETQLLSVS